MNILITQVSKIGSMCWIKCLKKIKTKNIVIYGTDIFPYGYSAGSILVDKFIEVTDEISSPAYINYIRSICTKYHIDLLLSVMDDELFALIKSEQFKNEIISPTIDVFSLFNDKLLASNNINKLGIEIPPIIENPFGQKKVIIRDRVNIGSRGIYVVDLKQAAYIENRFQESRFMQEYIEGDEYTVDVLTNKIGEPILIIPRKRIEIRQGVSFKCQLTNDQQIIQICQKIYKQYKIPGISNVQFIKNDSGIYFIELNTRIGGTTIASIIGGFNFVELFLDHYLDNKEVESLSHYQNLFAWGSIISRDYSEFVYLP